MWYNVINGIYALNCYYDDLLVMEQTHKRFDAGVCAIVGKHKDEFVVKDLLKKGQEFEWSYAMLS